MRYKIAFISGSRADFGLIQSVIREFKSAAIFQTCLIRVGHSLAQDEDYGEEVKDLEVIALKTQLGIHRVSCGQELGLAVGEITQRVTERLSQIQPDIVFIAGDRFEIFASCVAAYYLRVPIAHLHGGDRSIGGHMDDNVRHAITKLAQIHFSVCEDSYQRLVRMGELPKRVYNVGSPVVDNIYSLEFSRPPEEEYALLTYHPISSEPEKAVVEVNEILRVLAETGIKTLITAPNNEEGSDGVLGAIRKNIALYNKLEWVGNCGWKSYLNLLKHANFGIGNSSSLLVEAPILRTPTINVGTRQLGRYSPESVFHARPIERELVQAIEKVRSLDRDLITHPYGDGHVGKKILDAVVNWLRKGDLLPDSISY